MKTTNIFKTFCLLVTAITSQLAFSQQNNSLYFLDRVPQSIQLNPALQPSNIFYFGFPGVSGIEVNAGNNALGFNDILIQDKELNKLVTPLYSKDITYQTLNKLRKNNIFSSGLQVDLASFGFKIMDSYVSFLISDKANISTSIPKDLAVFMYEGIDVGKSYSFQNLGVNATYYREYSIGYSQKISDRIQFGLRGKMLFGKANLNSRRTNINISEPDWQNIDMSATVNVRSSIPNLEVHTDSKGKPDSISFNEFNRTSDLLNDLILLNKNRGFGLDLGLQFKVTDKISASASIIDLGYINWKNNVNTIVGGGDYRFQGINLNDSSDLAEALLDTLKECYDLSVSKNPYNTSLTPKLYVGISYTPNRFIKLGLLSRSEYLYKTFRQQITGSITLYPAQAFGATFSYTIADRQYDNLGIGLVFRGGPMQLYFMSDRIPLIWNKVKGNTIPILPAYAKSANFRMGINLVFGANIERKLKKDQPFLE